MNTAHYSLVASSPRKSHGDELPNLSGRPPEPMRLNKKRQKLQFLREKVYHPLSRMRPQEKNLRCKIDSL